jgi:hypothetical protein
MLHRRCGARVRRLLRLAVAMSAGATVLLAASPADAALDAPCEASGTIVETGETYVANAVDEAEIPRKGTVDWTGSVPAGDDEREINGFVKVDLPAPLPDPTVGSWDTTSDTYENSDTYTYDLPSVLEGFDIPVYGTHNDAGFSCSGSVTVRLEGGGIGNPLTLASLALALLSITNFALAVWVL